MEERSNRVARRKNPRAALPAAVVASALWVLFISSSINAHEMMVGALAVVAAIVFTFFTARTIDIPIHLRFRDLAEAWRIPWYVLSGVGEITLVLLKDVLHVNRAKNLFRVCGFDTSRHDPVRVARTVLAVAYTTTAPNFIVIGIDQTQSRMLFHQIESSSVPRMTRRLGAKG